MMIHKITEHIKELDFMKKYPKELFFKGDTELLKRKKISIVGSRKPNQYARQMTHQLSTNVIYNNKLYSTRINCTDIGIIHD